MKITLTAIGSRGDIQPMLALAIALKEAGHSLSFCASPDFDSAISQLEIPFFPLGDNMQEFMSQLLANYENTNRFDSKLLGAFMRKQTRAQFKTVPDLASGSDLIIGGGTLFGMPSVAEYLKKPYFYTAFCPATLPSSSYPPMHYMTNQYLPRWINKLAWKIESWINKKYMNPTINTERMKLGLSSVSNYVKYNLTTPFLVAADSEIAPVPSDVRADYHQTGAFILNSAEKSLDKNLEAFISAGTPPIYVGFGSMAISDFQTKTRLLIEASKELGLRFVLSQGWATLGDITLPENFFAIEGAPHDLLFPRMAAIIHHGGAGTLAFAARAGIPQIILPVINDQYYFGKQIFINGLGPKALYGKNLNIQSLKDALLLVTQDEKIRKNTASLKIKLEKTNGTQNAVKYLEKFMKGTRS